MRLEQLPLFGLFGTSLGSLLLFMAHFRRSTKNERSILFLFLSFISLFMALVNDIVEVFDSEPGSEA